MKEHAPFGWDPRPRAPSLAALLFLALLLIPHLAAAQGQVQISAPEEDKVICKDAAATVTADITCEGGKHRNPDVEVTYGGDADEDGTIITDVAGKKTLTATADGCSEDQRTVNVIELKRESPANDPAHLAFELYEPKGLTIIIKGTTGVPDLDENIEWEVEEIPGVVFDPSPAKGGSFNLAFQGMPEDNFGMGDKTLTMRYPEGGCEEVESKLRLFFMPNTRGNPQGDMPNWYYYWWDTRASGDKNHSYTDGCLDDEGNELYGYYLDEETGYHVCQLGNTPSDRQESCPSHLEGIDTYAATVIHERQHMLYYYAWWDPYDPEADLDDDRVPDDMEADMGLDPEETDTDGDGLYDEHDLVWNTECTWVVGAANKQDWSAGGKQSR